MDCENDDTISILNNNLPTYKEVEKKNIINYF